MTKFHTNFRTIGSISNLWGRGMAWAHGTPEPNRHTPSQLGGHSPTGQAGLINALKRPNYEQVEIQGDKGKDKYSEF